jgi:phosphoribosylformylglycinamidine cyclo-ligase
MNTKKSGKLKYKDAGVDYSKIDPVKVLAQKAAGETAGNLSRHRMAEIVESRGESAYVIDAGDFYIASITECLGTKALVADEMRKVTGKTYYDQIAQDTIAMAVNDIITVGASPVSIHAYWATGSSDWFDDEERTHDLVNGWKKACNDSGVAWGGGETPALQGVVERGAIDLAASCVGIIQPKDRLTLGDELKEGDAIVLFASSGIHANGLSLARKIAEKLPDGFAAEMPDGNLYCEGLLEPTILYAKVMADIFDNSIDVHYISNITGHGWRKIMRHTNDLTYRITELPPVPEVLSFMMEKGPVETEEAYASLNMGAGFAVFVPGKYASSVIDISEKNGIPAYVAGTVEKGKKQVIIEPLDLVFEGKSLNVR